MELEDEQKQLNKNQKEVEKGGEKEEKRGVKEVKEGEKGRINENVVLLKNGEKEVENEVEKPKHLLTKLAVSMEINSSLLHLTNNFIRTVLPWQAICCPRAIEELRDLRVKLMGFKFEQYILKMTEQLKERVFSFLGAKDSEVAVWLDTEVC